MIKLFAPDHAGEGLALDEPRVGVGDAFLQIGVKFVRFAEALSEDGVKVGKNCGAGLRTCGSADFQIGCRRAIGISRFRRF